MQKKYHICLQSAYTFRNNAREPNISEKYIIYIILYTDKHNVYGTNVNHYYIDNLQLPQILHTFKCAIATGQKVVEILPKT